MFYENKTVAAQNDYVKTRVEKVIASLTEEQRNRFIDGAMRGISSAPRSKEYKKALSDLGELKDPIEALRELLGQMSGVNFYQSLSRALDVDKEASLALNEAGIPGIVYDGGRDDHCFVVFDNKAVKIIETYNQMAWNNAQAATVNSAAWNALIDSYEAGTLDPRKSYKVMDTPLSLQLVGIPDLPIEISGSKLAHILEHGGMDADILRQLPQAMSTPLMILDSYADRKVVVLGLKDKNGATIIVPLDVEKQRGHVTVNAINNAYGKNPRRRNADGAWTQEKERMLRGSSKRICRKGASSTWPHKKAPCGCSRNGAIPRTEARHRTPLINSLYQRRSDL